jgi:phosphomannomutase
MKVNPEIFKHYDVRGEVGTDLTSDITYAVGSALANWLPKKGPVAVGHDMRPDSEDLAASLIKGLTDQGRDVWDIGQISTDMIYFASGEYKLAGGAVVTASHNPGNDNGIKMVADEAKPIGLDTGLDEIRDTIVNDSYQKKAGVSGKVITKDISNDWIEHSLSFVDIDKLKPLKIAVDAGNGMAGKIFPYLEKHVPFKVTQMYFELDGTFPNHEANPLKFETLKDIGERIKKDKLDGGIAFDGDGDRAFLIDENGEILTGAVMSSMIAEYFLKKNPGATIVYDIRNSRSVPELIKELGGKAVICRVGHSPLKQKMRDVDAVFGGEASGHFYFKDNWYADSGLIGALVGLYVLSLSDKKLSELKKQYTRYAAIPETNFKVADKDAVLKNVEDKYKDYEIIKIDGVTVTLPNDRWFNLRPSNTESLIRLNAEAKTQAELDELVKEVKALII